jgi:GNAT superfamily N-acetyltransferase
MRIRAAASTEAHALAALWLRSRAASFPAIPATVHTDAEVNEWFEDVVLPNREVWVAEQAGTAVALLVLENDWVDQLYVEPTATGGGIGGALLDHAKDRRPTGLRLWTFRDNANARRFYERHGFVVVAETAGDNEEHAPDVCYEWRPARTASPTERIRRPRSPRRPARGRTASDPSARRGHGRHRWRGW